MEKRETLLEIRDLRIEYVTAEATVYAVRGLDLSLEKGRTLGLVGETGAGKTTMAKGVMRLLPDPPARVSGGEIFFKGEDLLRAEEKTLRGIRGNNISMIFQDPMTSLNPVLTVGDQIAEGIILHQHKNRRQAMELAGDMLELVGIERTRLRDYPHQFSGGMKQRVVIAMALSCNPELLIADEPTTALDVTIQAQVLRLIKGLQEQYGTAMILITHDLGIVAEICDDVAIMYAGCIMESGSKEAIFPDARHPYTRGLFGCIPDLYADQSELRPIKGLMPDPANLPQGCPFAPRCALAAERCRTEMPPPAEAAPGHMTRCFAPEALSAGKGAAS